MIAAKPVSPHLNVRVEFNRAEESQSDAISRAQSYNTKPKVCSPKMHVPPLPIKILERRVLLRYITLLI